MPNDLIPATQADHAARPFDKVDVLNQVVQMARLEDDWNGYGAGPIDPGVIEAASKFIERLSTAAISAPQVVPMTRGRLQFEWHHGRRSLELEFETPTLIHYLKYDPNRAIEEEATLPVDDAARLIELLRWFHEE